MEHHRFSSTGSSSDSNHIQTGLTSLSSQRSLASVPSLNSHSHHHLENLPTTSHNCLTTFKGNTSYISSLTLVGKFLYTGSSDREIRSWNHTPFHHSEFNPQQSTSNIVVAGKGAVKSIVVHCNKLFSAHQDHKIRVWKIKTNSENDQKYTLLATLPTFGDRVSKLLIPKNHVQIRRHKKCTWVHHVDAVSSLALSKDGTLLYSVSWDRTIKVWRTKDFTCLESLNNAHDDAINAVAVSYDGYVYTGSADKRIKVWKKGGEIGGEKKHSLVDTLEKHKSGINALALNSDGSVLYSGACDRSILVSEKDVNGKLVVVGALRGHTKSILCLAVVSDLVCSGSEDKTIRIWRSVHRDQYSCLGVLEGHRGPIKSLTAVVVDHRDSSETSFLVYSGSLDCDIKMWQIFVPVL
ncbi:protein JINGUBANG-like [Gastrolobium bilobum]|uniref:protein JINGUBANG-like n=1 Tax=Gastrolobium bilobum TaxID=150636 RepID=UPI002AB2EAEF|nr:protein JINGUBANG-like [Gastrolobium bilobum]